jgi:hypothetical protein
MCKKETAILLDPVETKEDEYQILKNGSLLFPAIKEIAEADEFCVYKVSI